MILNRQWRRYVLLGLGQNINNKGCEILPRKYNFRPNQLKKIV